MNILKSYSHPGRENDIETSNFSNGALQVGGTHFLVQGRSDFAILLHRFYQEKRREKYVGTKIKNSSRCDTSTNQNSAPDICRLDLEAAYVALPLARNISCSLAPDFPPPHTSATGTMPSCIHVCMHALWDEDPKNGKVGGAWSPPVRKNSRLSCHAHCPPSFSGQRRPDWRTDLELFNPSYQIARDIFLKYSSTFWSLRRRGDFFFYFIFTHFLAVRGTSEAVHFYHCIAQMRAFDSRKPSGGTRLYL